MPQKVYSTSSITEKCHAPYCAPSYKNRRKPSFYGDPSSVLILDSFSEAILKFLWMVISGQPQGYFWSYFPVLGSKWYLKNCNTLSSQPTPDYLHLNVQKTKLLELRIVSDWIAAFLDNEVSIPCFNCN